MLQGLYKFWFETPRGSGSGVMFATPDGKLYGGNSGSSLVGSYTEKDGVYSSELMMSRHNHDPNYVPNYPIDNVAMTFTGALRGNELHSEGSAAALPGAVLRAIMTPINDADAPPAGKVGPDGIGNGLYSIHIKMLDGIDGGTTGVMLLQDGNIRGGDAFFDYIGAYSSANGRWKGEIVNQEHTPAKSAHPIFGGYQVGIGFAGSCDINGALLEATALAGKRSLRLTAVLKLMRPA